MKVLLKKIQLGLFKKIKEDPENILTFINPGCRMKDRNSWNFFPAIAVKTSILNEIEVSRPEMKEANLKYDSVAMMGRNATTFHMRKKMKQHVTVTVTSVHLTVTWKLIGHHQWLPPKKIATPDFVERHQKDMFHHAA